MNDLIPEHYTEGQVQIDIEVYRLAIDLQGAGSEFVSFFSTMLRAAKRLQED